jgi:hypothetical protein
MQARQDQGRVNPASPLPLRIPAVAEALKERAGHVRNLRSSVASRRTPAAACRKQELSTSLAHGRSRRWSGDMTVTASLVLPPIDADVERQPPRLTQAERRRTRRQKLVIEMPADLYERIVLICTVRQVPVNQVVAEVLERAFPSK